MHQTAREKGEGRGRVKRQEEGEEGGEEEEEEEGKEERRRERRTTRTMMRTTATLSSFGGGDLRPGHLILRTITKIRNTTLHKDYSCRTPSLWTDATLDTDPYSQG